MKYINMGSPDYEVYVPSSPLPTIVGTRDCDISENGQAVMLHSRLCYPEKTVLSPLKPKEVLKRFEEVNSKVPGLDYD